MSKKVRGEILSIQFDGEKEGYAVDSIIENKIYDEVRELLGYSDAGCSDYVFWDLYNEHLLAYVHSHGDSYVKEDSFDRGKHRLYTFQRWYEFKIKFRYVVDETEYIGEHILSSDKKTFNDKFVYVTLLEGDPSKILYLDTEYGHSVESLMKYMAYGFIVFIIGVFVFLLLKV